MNFKFFKNKLKLFLYVLFFYSLLFNCTINIRPPSITEFHEQYIDGHGKSKILVIHLNGLITQVAKPKTIFSELQIDPVTKLLRQLALADKDDTIKAIILSVNSPGGEVTATDIIYHHLMKFKQRKKIPILTHFNTLGTSGAYYIAMVSDWVAAHPTTITGSIGVVLVNFNAQGLMRKIGIENNVLKSAAYKDIGNPFRQMTPTERNITMSFLNDTHQRFVNVIKKGRKFLSLEKIKKLADGRIYTARQAQKNKLIDDIGYLEDTIKKAMFFAQLKEATIIQYTQSDDYQGLLYNQNNAKLVLSSQNLLSSLNNYFHSTSQLMYVWFL